MKNEIEEKERIRWGGGSKSYRAHLGVYCKHGMDFEVETFGAKKVIRVAGREMHYNMTSYENRKIGSCCRAINKSVDDFEAVNGIIEVPRKTPTEAMRSMLVLSLAINGMRSFSMIDINACYWTILRNSGIISQKMYSKYLEEKELRLVGVGNLNKSRKLVQYKKGEVAKSSYFVERGRRSWVWNYVLHRAHQLYLGADEVAGNRIFKFKTDAFYLENELVEGVCKYLDAEGFSYTVDQFYIIGVEKQNIICCNTETGEVKKVAVGHIKDLQKIYGYPKSA